MPGLPPTQQSFGFGTAAHRALSCRESVDTIINDLNLQAKPFKRYLQHHGYTKLLYMPILLLDLNGTLCFRCDRRSIALRPGITDLKRLKKYYRIGVYTSVTRYNTLMICDRIEDVCGRLFDRNLIFTREHTFPFSKEELALYNYPDYKMKKSICNVLAPDYAKITIMVDDEIERIVEKDHVMPISSWTGETTDQNLVHLIDSLIMKATSPSAVAE